MSKLALERLAAQFPAEIVSTHAERGNETAIVRKDRFDAIARFLKHDPDLVFDTMMDLTGVDYLGKKTPRFEIVVHLYSLEKGHRLRLRAEVPEDDAQLPSVTPIWRAANWFEREAWDLYGIRFIGHPDLRRILLYEEFEGHPLRNDYPIDGRQPLVKARPGFTHDGAATPVSTTR